MKKYLSVLLCLLLAVALLLTGCNGNKPEKDDDDGKTTTTTTVYVPTDEEAIVGTWIWEVKMEQAVDMDAVLGTEMGGMDDYFDFSKLVVNVEMTFNADGTSKLAPSEASIKDAADDIVDETVAGLLKFTEDLAAGFDMTFEEYLEAAQMTKDEYIASLKEDLDVDELIEEINDNLFIEEETGYYALKDGKLYMGDDKATLMDEENGGEYELNGNTLTLKKDGVEIVLNKK